MITEFYTPKQIVFGNGAFQRFVEHAKKLSMRYILLFYSPSAFPIEQKDKLKQQLLDANIKAYFFEMPAGEPTLTVMRIAVKVFRENGCDSVAAIGGSSALHLAKAVSAIGVNPSLQFEQLSELVKIERAPLIVVPTSAGSGSEVSRVAVLTDEHIKVKYKSTHVDLIPDIAILDPVLTVDMTPAKTAYAAMEALTNAIESYVSKDATSLSDLFALKAVEIIAPATLQAYHNPSNMEARGQLLLGSYYAGLAFSNAANNLVHIVGRVIGAKLSVPYGQSVAAIHPFIIEYAMANASERYGQVAEALQLRSVDELKPYLFALNDALNTWQGLEQIATDAFLQSTDEMVINVVNSQDITTNDVIPEKAHIEQLFLKLHLYVKAKLAVV